MVLRVREGDLNPEWWIKRAAELKVNGRLPRIKLMNRLSRTKAVYTWQHKLLLALLVVVVFLWLGVYCLWVM